jgi:radical SAM superfamily enzyme YgiQ (UPF0313 family)
MRFVLIKPLTVSSFYDPEVQEPLGLEYLASALKSAGCAVMIIDCMLDNTDDRRTARRTAAFCPDAVGFSITTDSSLPSVKAIYEEFCRVNDRPVLWLAGGNYVTTEPHNAMRELPVEIRLVRYEADIFIRNFVEAWRQGKVDSLPRIIDAEPPDDLDALAFPVRPFSRTIKDVCGGAFNVQASRGCCSACRYCASKGMRGSRPAWRGRSPENVVDELYMLYNQYDARMFNFVDEDFLGPPVGALRRAKDIAAGIKEKRMNISFGIQVRPNSMSEDVIDTLQSVGLGYVFMGIESDDPADFRRWGRAYCRDTWLWVDYLMRHNIEVNAGTLLFHQDCTFAGVRRFATLLHEHHLLNFRTAINRLDAMPGSFYYDNLLLNNEICDIPANGSISLPFKEARMEEFYQALRYVLEPLEAPSMHTMCALPVAQTARMITGDDAPYRQLKAFDVECDERVASVFFRFLDAFETLSDPNAITNDLHTANIAFARDLATRILATDLILSPSLLRHAVVN